MKVNRRSFLAYGIGAAAGGLLTPIPWKLTDDLSIWTQNWPWTPVPEIGPVEYKKTACTLCPGGCGIKARVIGSRVVKFEGDENHPVNHGGICSSGLTAQEYLYEPARIKSPLKRAGKRGEGKWKKISWDEAEAEVANKLTNCSKGALALFTSRKTGSLSAMFASMLQAKESENYYKSASMFDTWEMVINKMQGSDCSVVFDFENTDIILSLGCGIDDGWGSPIRMFDISNNKKIIHTEPRLSRTASKAHKWLPIKPGSETDFIYGLCNIIVTKKLYNKEFVEKFANDFDKFCEFLNTNFPLSNVSKNTGISEKTIIKTALEFASPSNKSIAIGGRGKGDTACEFAEIAAVHTLNAITGNINKPGGIWTVKKEKTVKSRTDFEKVLRSEEELNKIEVLLVHDANPLYTLAQPSVVKKSIDKIPYLVSFASFMDETADFADIILPDNTFMEKQEDIISVSGLPYYLTGLTSEIISPVYDTKNTGDALISIAGKTKGAMSQIFSSSDYEEYLKEFVGDNWDALVENKYVKEDFTSKNLLSSFQGTPSGKFEFFMELSEGLSTDEKMPLIVMPEVSMRISSGNLAGAPCSSKIIEETDLKNSYSVVEINPETAKQIKLNSGDTAFLETSYGKFKVKIDLFDGIMPGVISVPKGLGHKVWDEFLGNKGTNYNSISGFYEDPFTGANRAEYVRGRLVAA